MTETMTRYHDAPITHTGEQWQCRADALGEGYEGLADLYEAMAGEVGELYTLGRDPLPEGVEDIRGRIQGEPPIVVAYLSEHGPRYAGIVEREEEVR